MKWLERNFVRIGSVICVLYFGSYVLLSTLGKYDDRLDTTGKTKFVWGFSVPDIQIWQPKFLMLRSNNYNYGGLVYSPLIQLDRLLWHKNKSVQLEGK
jgi:hypothetical protein